MNQETFKTIYPEELTSTQKKVLTLFLQGITDQEIVNKIGANDRTGAIHHIKNICNKFGINPKEDPDYKESLVLLFLRFQPQLVSPIVAEKYGYSSSPHFPEGSEPLNSPYYIQPHHCQYLWNNEIQKPGALIRIKAPKQMGKTSLLKRIIAQAKNDNYYAVELDLSQIDTQQLSNISNFFRGFYAYFKVEFSSAPPLDEWDQDLSSTIHCTRQFQKVLKKLDRGLVLVLDEVDRLFEYPEIYQNFFPMLRAWHEKSKESETWEKLRLVLAHSTEDYGKISIHESPFTNVGISIQLGEFSLEEVQNLASRHLLNRDDAIPLMSMVGGHPYLVRLAFYHLYHHHLSLKQLLEDMDKDGGIYEHHLIRYLEYLQSNPELGNIFQNILNQESISIDKKTIPLKRLEGMGLIKQEGNYIRVRCKLYQMYFSDRLYV